MPNAMHKTGLFRPIIFGILGAISYHIVLFGLQKIGLIKNGSSPVFLLVSISLLYPLYEEIWRFFVVNFARQIMNISHLLSFGLGWGLWEAGFKSYDKIIPLVRDGSFAQLFTNIVFSSCVTILMHALISALYAFKRINIIWIFLGAYLLHVVNNFAPFLLFTIDNGYVSLLYVNIFNIFRLGIFLILLGLVYKYYGAPKLKADKA